MVMAQVITCVIQAITRRKYYIIGRKEWKGYAYWTRVKYRHPWLFRTYYALRNRFTPTRCGDYECAWAFPFGFVPEADCPVHDGDVANG